MLLYFVMFYYQIIKRYLSIFCFLIVKLLILFNHLHNLDVCVVDVAAVVDLDGVVT